VLVRVQSDDESAVTDMLAAAKERIPGLGAWRVRGDPELAPGDLVLEAAHSLAESRIEEHRSAVDAALRHLLLPATREEENGREDLARVNAEAVARMLALVPKRSLAPTALRDVAAAAEATRADLRAPELPDGTFDAEEKDGPDAEPPAMSGDIAAPAASVAPRVDLSRIQNRREGTNTAGLDAADATDAMDAVLAEGGFLPASEDA
jgi:hypothetical protein